ncbi:MAG: twin-arginine translocase TatA/TatE family subunit [Anaerolineae bacterium]
MFLSPIEIVFTLLLALLVFGPNKLPEIARSLGETVREFRRATDEAVNQTPDRPAQPVDDESDEIAPTSS